MNNPKADWKSRVAAHHLAGELTVLISRIHLEAPSFLARRHQFPKTPLTASRTTGLNLVVATAGAKTHQQEKNKEEEKPYDELDLLPDEEESKRLETSRLGK